MDSIELMILDFDGCLVHTHPAIAHCIKETFTFFHVSHPLDIDISKTISSGIGLADTFNTLLKDDSYNTDGWVLKYREIYQEQALNYVTLFPDVKSVLSKIHGSCKLVVVSNKGEPAIHKALDHFGIADYIDCVVGDRLNVERKPSPETYTNIISVKYPSISPRKTIMIGDTEADIMFSKNSGIRSAWVEYGYGCRDQCLAMNPEFIFSSFLDVEKKLLPTLLKKKY